MVHVVHVLLRNLPAQRMAATPQPLLTHCPSPAHCCSCAVLSGIQRLADARRIVTHNVVFLVPQYDGSKVGLAASATETVLLPWLLCVCASVRRLQGGAGWLSKQRCLAALVVVPVWRQLWRRDNAFWGACMPL